MFELDTLSVHAGARPDPTTGARATPIYQTTSFVFEDSDHAAALFNMERAGHVYSRLSNPTNAVLLVILYFSINIVFNHPFHIGMIFFAP